MINRIFSEGPIKVWQIGLPIDGQNGNRYGTPEDFLKMQEHFAPHISWS